MGWVHGSSKSPSLAVFCRRLIGADTGHKNLSPKLDGFGHFDIYFTFHLVGYLAQGKLVGQLVQVYAKQK